MRALAALVVLAAACGAAGSGRRAPKLASPDELDLRAPGAAYLAIVGGRLQPGWSQFLADCRQRLPAEHPLNSMTLAATAELAIDPGGHLTIATIAAPSGNSDFDRAVRDVLADAHEVAAPPRDLLADDDRVHVRWLFARDRRQAGPATAELISVRLPVATVVPRLIAAGELGRAAHRIAIAPSEQGAAAATRAVMVAAIAEALADTADERVRISALDAVQRGKLAELAPNVRAIIAPTTGAELRADAIVTAGALGDEAAVPRLLDALPGDLGEQPAVAVAEARALVALGRGGDAARVIAAALPTSAAAFAIAPTPSRVPALTAKFASYDAPTRAALCGALPVLAAGLRDADATVRASCADAAVAHASSAIVARLIELARDRDRTVRAHAIAALAQLAPQRLPIVDDEAPSVRAAYALALAKLPARAPALHALASDRDADVRAAAWHALAVAHAGTGDADAAAADVSAAVRAAVVASLGDGAALAKLVADDAPDVRSAALIRLAQLRGRAATEPDLLARLAEAPPASAERVRIALAWLLAS
jgi:HEAT repeat protein